MSSDEVEPRAEDTETAEPDLDFWIKWKIVRPLDDGGYAQTFLVCNLEDSALATLKWLTAVNQVDRENEVESYQMLRKLSILKRCEVLYNIPHPYERDSITPTALLLDYHSGPDLYRWLSSPLSNAIEYVDHPEYLWSILKSCCEELIQLHSQGITHGDVKPENFIFLSQSGFRKTGKTGAGFKPEVDLPAKLKLIDFGFAQKSDLPLRGDQLGTIGYVPPAWLPGYIDYTEPVSQSIDIYALGSLMYTMMAAKPAYDQVKNCLVFENIQEDFFPKDRSLQRLVRKMLHIKPKKRPSCSKILRIIELRDLC